MRADPGPPTGTVTYESTVTLLSSASIAFNSSQHLAALKSVGLVRDRRDGRITHYSVNPKGLRPLANWLSFYSAFWEQKFDALENMLKVMDQ